ncbi:hypothetical protein [Hymenobacter arizonensis]|uniref:hypothetical protein n=1 Tax=Hymenobacter arizonensis TaxID=1227077 RepID=UPI00116076E8|nr:hypothetical protein [Hymenobacter arizonensis]
MLAACSPPRKALHAPLVYPWFPFTWYRTTIAGKPFDKVAIMVPVKINDLPGNLVTQFDLGSGTTFLYEDALKNYFASRAQLYAHVDTAQRGTTDAGHVHYATHGLPLAFGGAVVPAPRLMTRQGDPVSPDSLRSPSPKLVGTLGADFLGGKVLVIDYPRRRMCVLDSVDAYWRARTRFVAGRVKDNRFSIPIAVNRRTYWALFDTGASLFPLSTDQATWQHLVRPGAVVDTLAVNSWGEKVPFYGAPMQHDAYLGTVRLPASKAWFTRSQRHLDFNKSERVDALTGNAFFLENTVVLDFAHARFGVVD